MSDYEKDTTAEISDDFCVIKYKDQTDRFIRVVLSQYIKDNCQTLDYGVWVSLSERSFNDNIEKYNRPDSREAVYFGYLNNLPSEYNFNGGIKMNVIVSNGEQRPYVVPHKDQLHIPFVKDYYDGITTIEALHRLKIITT